MLKDLIEERRRKLSLLRQKRVYPYPSRAQRTFSLAEVGKRFSQLSKAKKKLFLAGRVIGFRDQGSVMFLDLQDGSGTMQAVLKRDNLQNFDILKSALDRGDFVALHGTLFVTKRGERSIEVKECTIIAKSLRPIPTEFYGVKDKEILLRQRYLDFILNPELKELFKKKATFWQATRDYLYKEGFLEVETPILEAVPGGAEAEPFSTHYNALNRDVFLRISPELWLKRLMIAGFEKVFEIGRVFRNEGVDAEHLQDYTQMEMYWAYSDYEKLMEFVEKMVKQVIKETFGTLEIAHRGQKVHWGKKWRRYDYAALFKKHTGLDAIKVSKQDLLKKAKSLGIEHADRALGRGRLIDLVYKKTVRPALIEPGFLIDPPVIIEPLAKRKPDDPERVERFQLVAYGTELGKGFSELNDPIDQRERFEEQMKLRAAGDKEAQMLDEEYVEAMEHGMPPTAGFAYSERLFAVLADRPVREAVLFPMVRSKET